MTRWKRTRVAPSGDHHLLEEVPLYDARFDSVLKFHAPGLAPVRRGGMAWHIDVSGRPAYVQRYRRTFGFYENLAAVEGEDGWHHIRPDGAPLYDERYTWTGNFQGGRCPVRTTDGAYLHLDSAGAQVSQRRWRYAGDYRDGIAVVQSDGGGSTHVDSDGDLVHGRWFEDLDIFHKDFARARDSDGWCHVDRAGRPIYPRRFASVEPFYNGQARVERFDGGLVVIDEDGRTLVELRSARRDAFDDLSADIVGYWRTFALATAVELKVPEALPGTSDQLSNASGLPDAAVARLLPALAEIGIVEQHAGEWRLTARGALLRRDHPATLAPAALESAGPLLAPWRQLGAALSDVDGWSPPNLFDQAAEDTERVRRFHRMLQSYAVHDYVRIPQVVNWGRHRVVVDAGGGTGTVILNLLLRFPRLRGILLERPEVLEQVRVPRRLGPRLELRPGDLFKPWEIQADAVLLGRVLHDWSDDRCLTILGHAREALEPEGRLYLLEMVRQGHDGALCDLHLLVGTGGAERTHTALEDLLRRAGFAVLEVLPLGGVPSVVVAEPG